MKLAAFGLLHVAGKCSKNVGHTHVVLTLLLLRPVIDIQLTPDNPNPH